MTSSSVRRILLLVVTMLILASASARTINKTATTIHNTTGSGLHDNTTVSDNSTIGVSSCDLCQERGQCEQAYLGGPGVFCGRSRRTHQACCCHVRQDCPKTHRRPFSHFCDCHRVTEKKKHIKTRYGSNKLGWIIAAMFLVIGIFAMYWYITQRNRHDHYREETTPTRVPRPQESKV